MDVFKHITNGFHFVYEKELGAGEEVILKMPPVSPNKRGINDIGWQAEGDVILYGTLSSKPEDERAIWQEIQPFDEVNKTTAYIKIVNKGTNSARVTIRAILN